MYLILIYDHGWSEIIIEEAKTYEEACEIRDNQYDSPEYSGIRIIKAENYEL